MRKQSELHFRQLVENIPEVFFLTTPDNSELLYINPTYEEIWGRSCDSLYADPSSWRDTIHPDDRHMVRANLERMRTSGQFNFEYRIVRPDGAVRWIHARAFPVRDSAGSICRIAGIAKDITDQTALEEALREREAGLHRVQLMNKIGHIITGPDGAFESWSESLAQIIGVDSAQVPPTTRKWLDIIHPDDRAMFRGRAIEAGKKGTRIEVEYRVRRTDGAWIELRQVMEPLVGQADSRGRMRWFNTIQDVTEQKQSENKIRRLNRVYAVLSDINSAIVRIRERDELFREACRIAVEHGQFGFAWIGLFEPITSTLRTVAYRGIERDDLAGLQVPVPADTPVGNNTAAQAARSRKPAFCNDVQSEPDAGFMRADTLALGLRSNIALPLLVGDTVVGVMVLYSREANFFDDEEIKLLTEMAGDIAFGVDHIEKEERLNYLAYYDPLTGLPNDTLLQDRLTQFLQGGKPDDAVAVLLIDLDHFTNLNDTLGRHVGDTLLQTVAQRFGSALRAPYCLARISADAFAVAVADLKRGADAATIYYRRLLQSLGEPIKVDGHDIRMSARAGIALYPNDGDDAATLFKNAEAALKQAQSSGERYLYYTPAINAKVSETLTLETKLREAVQREQFVLHYQPKIHTGQGQIVGLEALIRWNDPQTGLVAPEHFIPVLEATGLILGVGEWALTQALSDFHRWRQQGLHPPRVAVNVSPVQLRRQDLAEIVQEVIERSGVGADALELEITEGLIMESIEFNTRTLQRIRDMGVTIAIDDFGTGYSSLGYLAKLPVDTLKIDRSFIVTMVNEPDSMAIVSTVIALAHSLEMSVVAEGVDAEEQADLLVRMKCDQIQGFLFSQPVPAEEIAQMLSAGRRMALSLPTRFPETRTLLVLDDDADYLAMLERDLRPEGYQIFLAGHAAEAFEILARHAVGVVLCDQRMPGMSGVTFLHKVRSMYPNTVRLMCSAYADFEAALAAINVGAVHKFIVKAADTAELRIVLDAAFHIYRKNFEPGNGVDSRR